MRGLGQAVMEERTILAEGAVIERLRRSGSLLDEHILAAPLVLEEKGREALRTICRSYLDSSVTVRPVLVSPNRA